MHSLNESFGDRLDEDLSYIYTFFFKGILYILHYIKLFWFTWNVFLEVYELVSLNF